MKALIFLLISPGALFAIILTFSILIFIFAFVTIRRMTARPIESTAHIALEKQWEQAGHPEEEFDAVLPDGKKVHGKMDKEGKFEYVDPETEEWVVCEQ